MSDSTTPPSPQTLATLLATMSTSTLKALRATLKSSIHVTTALNKFADSHGKYDVGKLKSHCRDMSKDSVVAWLDVVINERERGERRAAQLVWSGAEISAANVRPTRQVLNDLFMGAQDDVLIAGYSFRNPEEILKPLYERMLNRPELRVRIIANLRQKERSDGGIPRPTFGTEREAKAEMSELVREIWPFPRDGHADETDGTDPEFYYDARYMRTDEFFSMHAKCVIVDSEDSLVGSANFTNRAVTRNVELGLYSEGDAELARNLVALFDHAIEDGVFIKFDPKL